MPSWGSVKPSQRLVVSALVDHRGVSQGVVQSGVVSFQLFEDTCKDRVSTQQTGSQLSR